MQIRIPSFSLKDVTLDLQWLKSFPQVGVEPCFDITWLNKPISAAFCQLIFCKSKPSLVGWLLVLFETDSLDDWFTYPPKRSQGIFGKRLSKQVYLFTTKTVVFKSWYWTSLTWILLRCNGHGYLLGFLARRTGYWKVITIDIPVEVFHIFIGVIKRWRVKRIGRPTHNRR